MPTGKANTENRRSLHLAKVLSNFVSGCRSLTAASPKNVICSNWNKKTPTVLTSSILPSYVLLTVWVVFLLRQQVCSPNSETWGTSKALRRQRSPPATPLHPYQRDSWRWKHTSWIRWCGTPCWGLKSSWCTPKWSPEKEFLPSQELSTTCVLPFKLEVLWRLVRRGTSLSRYSWALHTRELLFLTKHGSPYFIIRRHGMWQGRNFTPLPWESVLLVPRSELNQISSELNKRHHTNKCWLCVIRVPPSNTRNANQAAVRYAVWWVTLASDLHRGRHSFF